MNISTSPAETMSKLEQAVARVFFDYDDDQERVTEMRGLPLQDHLKNVALLAQKWDFARAFENELAGQDGSSSPPYRASKLYETRQKWLVAAAERHDEGKVSRFSIVPIQQSYQFTYSFRGHRFEVIDDRPYVQWLIRLHHGFSIHDITEAQARLRERPELAALVQWFPLDLYALEMCDQIEAELASRAFEKAGPHRVFMEFDITDHKQIDDHMHRVKLYPYPFAEPEVCLTLQSFLVNVPDDFKQGAAELKTRLLQGPRIEATPEEFHLCPEL